MNDKQHYGALTLGDQILFGGFVAQVTYKAPTEGFETTPRLWLTFKDEDLMDVIKDNQVNVMSDPGWDIFTFRWHKSEKDISKADRLKMTPFLQDPLRLAHYKKAQLENVFCFDLTPSSLVLINNEVRRITSIAKPTLYIGDFVIQVATVVTPNTIELTWPKHRDDHYIRVTP